MIRKKITLIILLSLSFTAQASNNFAAREHYLINLDNPTFALKVFVKSNSNDDKKTMNVDPNQSRLYENTSIFEKEPKFHTGDPVTITLTNKRGIATKYFFNLPSPDNEISYETTLNGKRISIDLYTYGSGKWGAESYYIYQVDTITPNN